MRVTPPPLPVPRLMRDEFADDVAVADDQFGAFAGELLVLRIAADRGEAVDAVVAADARRAFDDVQCGPIDRAVADFDVRADDAVRADADVGADARGRIDDGAWDGPCAGHRQPFDLRAQDFGAGDLFAVDARDAA